MSGRCAARIAILSLPSLALAATPAHAIMGCLTPEEKLAPRADVVVVGRIVAVGSMEMPRCPPRPDPKPDPSRPGERTFTWRADEYFRCDSVLTYEVVVTRTLRGTAPERLTARVPWRGFELSCDERPDPGAMKYVYATLYLEAEGGTFWLVDGANGVHGSWSPIDEEAIRRTRAVLRAHTRVHDATTR